MKQSNFHTAMLKIKRTVLLAVGLTLFQIKGCVINYDTPFFFILLLPEVSNSSGI